MLRVELWDILFILINLIVLYAVMRLVLIKPIRKVIEQRQAIIDKGLRHAKNSEENARALENLWNEKIASVEEKSADMIAQARKNAQIEYDKMIGNANSEAAGIVERARKSMDLERDKAISELQSQIADIAMDATKKVLENSDLSSIDNSLYEKFLTKSGDADDSDSH